MQVHFSLLLSHGRSALVFVSLLACVFAGLQAFGLHLGKVLVQASGTVFVWLGPARRYFAGGRQGQIAFAAFRIVGTYGDGVALAGAGGMTKIE